MKIKPIKTKEDHAKALERIEFLMGYDRTTELPKLLLEELEILAILVQDYEEQMYPSTILESVREDLLMQLQDFYFAYSAIQDDLGRMMGVKEAMNAAKHIIKKTLKRSGQEGHKIVTYQPYKPYEE